MTESRRSPRADRGQIRVQPRDQDGVLWVAEQSAVRRDQMARYLGRRSQRATKKPGEIGPTTLQDIIDRWCTLGLVQTYSRSKNEHDWLYVTAKGLRALNLPYNPWVPKRGSQFDHMLWVNEVRLLLEDRYAEGRWVSERHIRHYRALTHYPDGEFYLPQATTAIAIEVERSLKNSERLERILPWLVARYATTWYFAVEHEVLVRVQTKREALSLAQQERLFISRYDERNQAWHTDLRQASPRSTPVEPDPDPGEPEPDPGEPEPDPGEPEPLRAKHPAVSEVLQEIADEWVPPDGDQLGTKRLPLLSPRWLPQTFEDAVVVATKLLSNRDKAMLREMQGCTHSEHLWEWSQRLQEQFGLQVWGGYWSGPDKNEALWLACGRREPAEIVFHIMEEVWWQFQDPPPFRHSRQLIRAHPLPPLPRAEWPSTREEAARLARRLLSPFEVLWLQAHHGHDTWHDRKFPHEWWRENLLDQFGLRPPQRKGTQEWNETLWRAANTTGKSPSDQELRVKFLVGDVIRLVKQLVEQEAKDAQPTAPPQAESTESRPWGWSFPGVTSNLPSGAAQASPWYAQLSLRGCMALGIGLPGGVSLLVGMGMIMLGSSLHTIGLGSIFFLLGLAAVAMIIYLALH